MRCDSPPPLPKSLHQQPNRYPNRDYGIVDLRTYTVQPLGSQLMDLLMTIVCAMYAYKQSTSKSSYTQKLSEPHLLSLCVQMSVDHLPPLLEETTDTSSCSSTTTLGGQVYGCYPTRKPKPAQRHIRHFKRRSRLWATPSSISGAITNEESMTTSSSKCY